MRVLLIASLLLISCVAAQDMAALAAEARRAGEWGRAAVLYDSLAEAARAKGDAQRRISALAAGYGCRARTGALDASVTALEALAGDTRDASSRLLIFHELGGVHAVAPRWGSRKGGVLHRGEFVQGGEHVQLEPVNLVAALAAYAKALDHIVEARRAGGDAGAVLSEVGWSSAISFASCIERYGNMRGEDAGPLPLDLVPQSWRSVDLGTPTAVDLSDRAYRIAEELEDIQHPGLAAFLRGNAMWRAVLASGGEILIDASGSWCVTRSGKSTLVLPSSPAAAFERARDLATETLLKASSLLALARCHDAAGRHAEAAAHCRRLLDEIPKSILADDARSLLETITLPQIRTEAPNAVRPGAGASFEARWRNVSAVEVRVVALPFDELVDSSRGMRDPDFEPCSVASCLGALSRRLDALPAKHVISFTSDSALDHRWQRQLIQLPPLSAGTWCVRVRGGGVERCELLFVSDLGLMRVMEPGRSTHFVASHATGQAVPDAVLHVRELLQRKGLFGHYRSVQLAQVVSDAKGVALHEREESGKVLWSLFDAVVFSGAHSAAVAFEAAAGSRDISTERVAWCERAQPLWRPGQRVSLLFLLRQHLAAGGWAHWPEESVRVELAAADGERIDLGLKRMDGSGALALDYDLPFDAAPGSWSVWFTAGRSRFFAGQLQVEEYRKPDVTVECTGPLQPVRLGDVLRCTVKARSFSGESMAGAALHWNATRHAEWLAGTSHPKAAHESPEPAGSGSLALDARGVGVFEIDTRAFAARASASRFRVSVDVQDPTLRKVATELQHVVARTALVAGLDAGQSFGSPGESIPFHVHARDVQGRAMVGKGRLEVRRILSGSGVSERLGPVLDTQQVQCGPDGESLAHWKARDAGRYLVRVRLEDPLADEVEASVRIWIHDSAFDSRAFELKGVELLVQSLRVEAGASIQALVSTEIPDADVLVLATPVRGPARVFVARAQGHLLRVDVPVNSEDVPGIQLAAFSATPSGFGTASVEVDVPPTQRTLEVRLSALPAELRPGAEVLLEAEVRDANGKPVAARILVAVHDAALDEIVKAERGDIVSFFHRREGLHAARISSSVGVRTTGVDRLPTPWTDVEPMHWMPGADNDVGRIMRWWAWSEAARDDDADRRRRTEFEVLFGRVPERRHGLVGFFDGIGRLASVGAEAARSELAPGTRDEMKDSIQHDMEGEAASTWGVAVRRDFRDSAVFAREIQCDASGRASCRFRMPEDLSEWKGRVVAWTALTDVGECRFDLKTVLPVQARMILPRALVAGDRIDVRLLGTRTSGCASDANWDITANGDCHVGTATPAMVHLAAGNTTIATATLETPVAGSLVLNATLRGPDAASSDGLALPLTVRPDGTPVADARQFAVASGQEAEVILTPPVQHLPGSQHMRVDVRASMVLQLFDCLPFLLDDPWECTDHVVARFVPAALVRSALEKSGLRLEEVADAARRAPRPAHVEAPRVLDSRELSRVIERCRRQLRVAQNADGGFGWWEDSDSSVTMTVRVLDGLNRASAAGVAGLESMSRRAANWLSRHAKSERDARLLASMAMVLGPHGQCPDEVLEDLVLRQAELPALSLAELASALKAAKRDELAARAVAVLVERGQMDVAAGTFSFPASEPRWAWWNARIETAAAALEAFIDVAPDHPAVPLLAQWMLRNRRAQGWTNMRDTARAIQSLVRLAEREGALEADLSLEISIGGVASQLRLDAAQRAAPLIVDLPMERSSPIPVRIAARGKGKAHVLATLHAVATGEDVRSGAHGLAVTRRWLHVAADGRALGEVVAGEVLQAGTLLRTVLDIEAGMDAEYVFVSDPRAAGFEPVASGSGWTTQNGLRIRREVRDDRTAFFIEHLQQGRHTITQDVRVESAGSVKALPARIEALYAPEFSGHSTARRFDVRLPSRNQ